jgi:hypothetical protein
MGTFSVSMSPAVSSVFLLRENVALLASCISSPHRLMSHSGWSSRFPGGRFDELAFSTGDPEAVLAVVERHAGA